MPQILVVVVSITFKLHQLHDICCINMQNTKIKKKTIQIQCKYTVDLDLI